MTCNHCGQPAEWYPDNDDGRLPLCYPCHTALCKEDAHDADGYVHAPDLDTTKRKIIGRLEVVSVLQGKLSGEQASAAALLEDLIEAQAKYLIRLCREVKCKP